MDKPISYGTNTQISILKSKLLMISSVNTLAYMSPVIENVDSHMDDGLCSDEEVPLVN